MNTAKRYPDVLSQALLGACLLTAGILAWQVYSAPSPVDPGAEHSVTEPTIAEIPQSQRPAIEGLARLAATRERPLFHASRRPAPPPPVVLAVPEERAPKRFRLVGTTLFGGTKIALLEPVAGGRVIRARQGQRIGAWRILDVDARSVVMESPKGVQKLRLTTDRQRQREPQPLLRQSSQRPGDQKDAAPREDKRAESAVPTQSP